MWDELSTEEQLQFLIKVCGTSNGYPSIDYELIFLCESVLNNDQRRDYVDYMSGAIADHTYRRVDPEHPDAATHYYFNMMHAAVPLRAKMIWCAVTGNQP
jgi:hypothetical protein